MSDPQQVHHALTAFLDGYREASSTGAGVRVTVCPARDHLNLRGDPRDDGFLSAAREALGQPLPVRANTFVQGERSIFWLGPDEWLLVTPAGEGAGLAARLEASLAGRFATVNELSGGQILLQLGGADTRALLARGCTLDLHPRAFSVGQCAQSGLARAGMLLAMTGDEPTFAIVVRRTFADYVARWLVHAGGEFGVVFGLED